MLSPCCGVGGMRRLRRRYGLWRLLRGGPRRTGPDGTVPARVRLPVHQVPADGGRGRGEEDAVAEESGGNDQPGNIPAPVAPSRRPRPRGPAAGRCPGCRAGPRRGFEQFQLGDRRHQLPGRPAAAGRRRRADTAPDPGRGRAGVRPQCRPPAEHPRAGWRRSPRFRPAGERCTTGTPRTSPRTVEVSSGRRCWGRASRRMSP